MTSDAEDMILRAIEAAEEKPELLLHRGDLPAAARELRDLLAARESLFDRGVPVKLTRQANGGPMLAVPLTVSNVVVEAHYVCQPMQLNKEGWVGATLPDRLARMYLDMFGDWNLRPLAGITTAPLLVDDGACKIINADSVRLQ